MKITDVQIGGRYIAKVSGMLTTVQVTAIRQTVGFRGRASTCIDVVNQRTGRRLTFASAQRLRRVAAAEPAQEGAA